MRTEERPYSTARTNLAVLFLHCYIIVKALRQQSELGPSCGECMDGSCVACDAPCEEIVEEHADVEFLSITFNHIVNIVVTMHRMRRIRHGVRHC